MAIDSWESTESKAPSKTGKILEKLRNRCKSMGIRIVGKGEDKDINSLSH